MSSSFQNRYPSPSKVVIAEKIDKIDRHETEIRQTQNIVVNNYSRSPNMDEPSRRLVTIKSQPILLTSQRSVSPPQTQMTQKLIYHQPINPINVNIVSPQRNLSPPQQNIYNSNSSISMMDNFNPNSNKNIYTVKHNTQPLIPRPQSSISPIKIIS